MDTITVQTTDGRTLEMPLVVAFDRDGAPMELVGDMAPENCDHAGACWSPNLDLRCPRCGSRLFLPPRFLARRDAETVEAMHAAWARAGWPEFRGGGWSILPDRWTVIPYPLFDHLGGLAVRNRRPDSFPEARGGELGVTP